MAQEAMVPLIPKITPSTGTQQSYSLNRVVLQANNDQCKLINHHSQCLPQEGSAFTGVLIWSLYASILQCPL